MKISHTICRRCHTHRWPETVHLRMRRINSQPQEAYNNVPNSVPPEYSSCQNAICSNLPVTVSESPTEPACDSNREALTVPCCPLAASLWTISSVLQFLHPGCPARASKVQRHSQQEQARRSRTFGGLHTTAGSKSAVIFESMTPELPNSSRNPRDSRDHLIPQVDQDLRF